MKFRKPLLLLLLALALPLALGQDLVEVNFQSKWFPQSQFAGYFVAQDKGFYAEEGLTVNILDGGNVNPTVQVASGNADFGTDWSANMLVQRDQGLDVVMIAQMYQDSGYRLVTLRDSGIETFADLAGTRVGVWGFGNEFAAEVIFDVMQMTSNLDPTVSNPDIEAVVYAFDPALVFPDEVEAASAMTYNELDQIVGLGYPLDTLNILDPADVDAAIMEDLVFTRPEVLEMEDFKGSGLSGREVAERFLRASIRGWEYAVANQEEAVQIVLEHCGDTCAGSGSTSSPLIHQTWQLARVAELVKPTPATQIGSINREQFERTVELLVDVGLIDEPVAFGDVVDTGIYEAVSQ